MVNTKGLSDSPHFFSVSLLVCIMFNHYLFFKKHFTMDNFKQITKIDNIVMSPCVRPHHPDSTIINSQPILFSTPCTILKHIPDIVLFHISAFISKR